VLVNAIGGSLSEIRINLLDTKYNLPEMLVHGLVWFDKNPKLVYLILSAIRKILDLDDERQMLDMSIQSSFIKHGLYEELSKLINHTEDNISNLAGKLLDDITDDSNIINNI
jgi:hypothetical protein